MLILDGIAAYLLIKFFGVKGLMVLAGVAGIAFLRIVGKMDRYFDVVNMIDELEEEEY